jgi:Domain of unknown function (DUF397)
MSEDRSSTRTWQRSTRCDSGQCVEVARGDGHVLVRNSNRPDTVLTLSADQWHALIGAIRSGAL